MASPFVEVKAAGATRNHGAPRKKAINHSPQTIKTRPNSATPLLPKNPRGSPKKAWRIDVGGGGIG